MIRISKIAMVFVGMLLVMNAATPVASARSGPRSCWPSGSTTIKSTSKWRIFRKRYTAVTFEKHGVYSCLYRSGHPLWLEIYLYEPGVDGFDSIRWKDNTVALVERSWAPAGTQSRSLHVWNILARRNVARVDFCLTSSAPSFGCDMFTDVAVGNRNSFAYIGHSWTGAEANEYVVGGQDSTGPHTYDSGATVSPRSLTLRGSTLTWVNGGATRSTQMTP